APEKALTFYRRALSMRKGSSETHFRIAGVLKELGKRGEAVSHFRQAISLDPDNANAHYGLAQVLLAQGDAEEGTKLLSTFSTLKEYEGRLVPLKRAVEMAPRDPQAAYDLAMLHMEYGRMQKGLTILQRILKMHPDFTKAKDRIEESR
ncbi:MAG: tetratricopeptide repeat protein, partial [Candidatus Latescibacterota bacterium]